jgi:raffinose/stachyose/melibiose transport system permease protein
MNNQNYSSKRNSLIVKRIFQYLVLGIAAILIFIPIIILLFGSVKTTGQMYSHPYDIPTSPDWTNIIGILTTPNFWLLMSNSLIVMICTTTGTVFICSLVSFVLARLQFKGKGFVFNLFTVGLMFPINVAILPVYFVLKQMDGYGLHLMNSLAGAILVQIAFQLSGNIMILRGFFTAVPTELQDSAYIDGCTNFDFFWRILLPLVKPSLAAVGALVMIVSWNDLLVPLVVLNNDKLWTLPLGTMQFQGQYGEDLALISAFVALASIPTIIFYFFAEKQIVSGLTAGAVKG